MSIDDPMENLIAAHPAAGPIFQRYGLAFCCGPSDLRTACIHAGVDPERVWQEVLAAEQPNRRRLEGAPAGGQSTT